MSRAGEHALLMSVVTTGIIKKSSRAPFLFFYADGFVREQTGKATESLFEG